MMIDKRLIGTVSGSMKYIIGNVIFQWCSLLANIVMMTGVFCQEEIPKIGKKIPYFRKGKSLLSEKDNPVLLKRASPLHSALVKWLFAA